IILVMGMTGAGKSYLIRDISGQDVEVGDDLESCTQNIEPITCEIDGELVTILDTPGFDDTKRSDTQVLTDVAEYLAVLYSGDYKVSGIIYLHNIAETRLRGSNVKNLEMFDRLCGKDAYGNVVMLTRGWGLQTTPSALKRELQLKDKHWRDYLVEGCKLDRYQDRDDLIRIFKAMLCNRPVALKIQQEMVVERKGLLETAAGQHINQELIIQKKAFDEELASIIRRYD
ncbi:P-loop containing nucleoside triphosphate hydrolase protein, partial [Lobosporangium transversale]